MLDLPGVTLCCIDTVNHALALRALRRSSAAIRFGAIRFVTDRAHDEPGIDTRVIAPLGSRDAYSQFVLKSLLAHIDTPHVLVVQWDGYVVNPDAWRPEFLEIDYIGAGPIRSTASKADHAAPIGMDGLARMARAAEVPTVAIGGLKLTH